MDILILQDYSYSMEQIQNQRVIKSYTPLYDASKKRPVETYFYNDSYTSINEGNVAIDTQNKDQTLLHFHFMKDILR